MGNGKQVEVVVTSEEYWDGPVTIKMSESAYNDPKQRISSAAIALKPVLKELTLFSNITEEDLKNDQTIRFELKNDYVEEVLPDVPIETVPAEERQRYERPEDLYHQIGGHRRGESM